MSLARSIAALLALLVLPAAAHADGGIWMYGVDEGHSSDQVAVLLYDSGTRTETMLLTTRYEGAPGDFAWVIPVPELPTRDQVDVWEGGSAVLSQISSVTEPRAYEYGGGMGCFAPGCAAGGASDAAGSGDTVVPGVEVVDRLSIAGLDISLLNAARAEDLTSWLSENGYHFAPAGGDIVEHYIARRWQFVAVKVDAAAPPSGTEAAQSGYFPSEPLRLTFPSDEIVFPMRISAASTGAEGASVLLYVLADHRVRSRNYPTVEVVPPKPTEAVLFPSAYEQAFRRQLDQPGGRALLVEYAQPTHASYVGLQAFFPADRPLFLTRLRTHLRLQDMRDDIVLVPETADTPFEISVSAGTRGPGAGLALLAGALCFLLRRRSSGRPRRLALREALLAGALLALAVA